MEVIVLTELWFSDEIKRDFSGISIAHAEIIGLTVKKRSGKLKRLIREHENEAIRSFSMKNLLQNPTIQAYRNFARKTKGDPTKEKPASEAITRALLKRGNLWNINNVVDCMNVVSLKTLITASAWDKDRIEGDLILRYSREHEKYRPIGEEEILLPVGEVVTSDQKKILNLIRYRDSAYAMVTRKTKNIIVHVQGVPGVPPDRVKKAMSQLKRLILDFAGGKIALDLFVAAT